MQTALVIFGVWCALSVVFAGVHYRWVCYDVAKPAAPSPMDVLQALPPYQPAPGIIEVAVRS